VSLEAFLSGLAEPHAEALVELGRTVEFRAGHRLFAEGGTADRFWLIRCGQVALDVHVPGRGPVLLETLGAGQVLGWSWLAEPHRWHFGAVSREPTEAVEFEAAAVRARCAADPEFGCALLGRFLPVLVNRLQATRVRLLDLYAPHGGTPVR
jgi:CRP/FNR family transcriptional regulator, cyclic AMP receptor protein